MVVLPTPAAVARPVLPMVATAALLELQVIPVLKDFVEPSLKLPVAVNCCVPPMAIEGEEGVTEMETSVGRVLVPVRLNWLQAASHEIGISAIAIRRGDVRGRKRMEKLPFLS